MRVWSFFKMFFWAILSLTVLGCIIVIFFLIYIEAQLPNIDELKHVQLQVPLRIYTSDNKLLAEYGVQRRDPVRFDQIPKKFVEAVLATEDERFYTHSGVDILGLGRATLVVLATGHKAQGGSTITMQVARNYFLTRKKTYMRKIREILLAFKINHLLSKDKVLELYFNKIFYGNRAYGVSAAAHTYYGEPLQKLTLPQMAMLAGLPKAPSTLNPIVNPEAAMNRRNHVLTRMLDQKYITKAEYEQAIQAPITAKLHQPPVKVYAPYVATMVQQAIEQKYGADAYSKGLQIYTTINSKDQRAANHAIFTGVMAYDRRHGYRGAQTNLGSSVPEDLTVWQNQLQSKTAMAGLTTGVVIDLAQQTATVLLKHGKIITLPWSGLSWARAQFFRSGQENLGPQPQTASDILKIGDVVNAYQDKKHWWLAQKPLTQAAFISLNPNNGAITSLVGGIDYASSQFDRATQAYRQPGSSFKPFIYSAALAKGYTLASRISDAPIVLDDSNASQLWRPENDTRKFYGMVSLQQALMQSNNLASIRLLQLIGIPYAINYASRFGFAPKQFPKSLSMALGTASMTPLQLARAYAVFANGGYLVTPHMIAKVTLGDGHVIYQANLPTACPDCSNNPQAASTISNLAPQMITPQNAYLMTDALKHVISDGTAKTAKVLNRPDLAGKTGTTNDKRDDWFSGYNANIVATTWIGFDKPQPLYEYGNEAALPIWIEFMKLALKNEPMADIPQPPGIIRVRIDPTTGKPAPANATNAIFAPFRTRYAPQTGTDASATAATPDNAQNDDSMQESLEQQIY